MNRLPFLLIFLLFYCIKLNGQDSLITKRLTAGQIFRDMNPGEFDQAPEWKSAEEATGFRLNFPSDSVGASGKTVVRILYSQANLYIRARLYRPTNARAGYVVSSLKRDFVFTENDAFGVILNPFNDRTNGYGFYVNAYGVESEEQISNGTISDPTWDIKWFCQARTDSMGWLVEMKIPFRYIRYSKDLKNWSINFVRNDIYSNERSSWQPLPRNFAFPNLAYSGKLLWPVIPEREPRNISLIPSLTDKAVQSEKNPVTNTLKASLDAKITVSSSLNLDLTINPDFSEAEVDQAQVNLSRFDISFPEKRLFFIENSDLFSSFGVNKDGSATIQPFYSRNIGLKYNSATGQYEQTQIIAGARFSGKLNPNLRSGLMNVQTAALKTSDSSGKEIQYPGQNYTVFALQQRVFYASNIGLIFTNRQSAGDPSTPVPDERFNRLAGLEYNLISANGQWTGKLFHETMFAPEKTVSAQGFWLNLNTSHWGGWAGLTRAGKDFSPDLGFVPRNNFTNLYADVMYTIYPKSNFMNTIQPVVDYRFYLDSTLNKTDHFYKIGPVISLKNTGQIYLLLLGDYTRLSSAFNPSFNTGKPLPAGSAYSYNSIAFYYLSDVRKSLSGQIYFQGGQYFNGRFAQFIGNLNYKMQPYGTFGFNYSLTFIDLPKPYSGNAIFALGPQAQISFSKKLFFNANVQYTSLNANLNYFFRIQWRFKPLSDFYLVYTNNENMTLHQRQNQSLILKFSYFL